jgi:diadenosine tetraphosphatase ApaH/serine/threonine PP2A family protein phosphatase
MRFAIFGDIHANLEALQAVLADAKANECTHYVCMGDIVGYNANPRECLEIVRDMNCPTVKGNHDEDSSNEKDLEGLNPLATYALLWTRNQLAEDQKKWLRELKFVRQVRDFTIVHATLDSPGSWAYVMNKFDAMASFSYQFSPVCFHGHTHVPKAYVKDESVRAVVEPTLEIKPGCKYFINVGSVGQPRDGDWRASYAIYDIEHKLIVTRRLEYDIATAQQKILDAGLPEMLANRLAFGK